MMAATRSGSRRRSGHAQQPWRADLMRAAEDDREDEVTVMIDSGEPTPEAQLQSFNDRFDPKHQKLIRSVRAAVRKRFPTANELVYDYSSFFVLS